MCHIQNCYNINNLKLVKTTENNYVTSSSTENSKTHAQQFLSENTKNQIYRNFESKEQ